MAWNRGAAPGTASAAGEPVALRKGDFAIEPFGVVEMLLGGDDAPAEWQSVVSELGIADLSLAP